MSAERALAVVPPAREGVVGEEARAVIEALGKPFPPEAVRQRQGGGGARFSYVAGPDVIRRLTRATGGQWSWAIKSFEFRPLPPTSKGAEQSLVVVMGELTIPGLGTRAGIGVQKVSEAGGEDLVKGASTDALKKAATLFGVALELYGEDHEAEEPRLAYTDEAIEARIIVGYQMFDAGEPGRAIFGHLQADWEALTGDQQEQVNAAAREIKRKASERKAVAATPPSYAG